MTPVPKIPAIVSRVLCRHHDDPPLPSSSARPPNAGRAGRGPCTNAGRSMHSPDPRPCGGKASPCARTVGLLLPARRAASATRRGLSGRALAISPRGRNITVLGARTCSNGAARRKKLKRSNTCAALVKISQGAQLPRQRKPRLLRRPLHMRRPQLGQQRRQAAHSRRRGYRLRRAVPLLEVLPVVSRADEDRY